MSGTQQPASNALPEFKAGSYYRVDLRWPVEFPAGSGTFMRPGEVLTWEGAFCLLMKDAIADAIPDEPA